MGSGLISYAADEQDEVKFDAKILNAENEEVTQADIATELKLHLNISVEEGTLKDIDLNLDNCNFKLKDEKSIDQIKAGEIDLAIVAKNEDSFKLDLLNMENKIKLTARYLKDNETSQIEKEKEISLKWNSENLNTMDEETRKETKILNAEIITNKTYTIDGEQKRVIQVKVKSGIKDNIYPIEKTVITLNPIEIGEINENKEFINAQEIKAEAVEVSAYSTKATNGQDGSINFETIEENKLGSWKYNSESGKTTITVNNSKDENNNVAWAKNAVDEFVVTYIYSEENMKAVKALKAEVENNIKLYTDEGEHTKTASIWETNSEKEMLMELNVQSPESISKKYISQGKEFTETYTLNISTTKIGENILVVSNVDELNISNKEDVQPSTTYKTTYINKEEFLNILGNDGEIILVNTATNEAIGQITKDSVDAENENLLSISYPDNVNQLGILLSKPIKEGKINIQNIKTLNISNIADYTDNIEKIEKLILKSLSAISDAEGNFVFTTNTVTKEILLTNPQTNVELGLDLGQDKTTLPVGEENKINFTVTLHTSEDNSKLFNNPTVQIELPSQVKQASIVENTENISNANGLNLNGITINNNVIEIKLTGNQEEYADYNGQDTTITFSANLKTAELLPTSTENIKLLVVNEEETAEDLKQVTFSAEKGILLANSISNYNGEEPELVAIKENTKTGLLSEENSALPQIKGTIINNSGKEQQNVIVIGNFAEEGSTIAPTLKEQITVENATVEYTADGETWEAYNPENATTYKSYKITFAKLEDKSVTTFTYKIEIPANLGSNKYMESTYTVKIGEQQGKAKLVKLETPQKIELEVTAEAISNTIYEEQEITFTVNVTNKSNAIARNVSIEANLPEELELVSKPENFDIEEGKTVTKTITAKVKALPEETKQKEIITTIKATPNEKAEQSKTAEVKNVVKKALIKATIEDAYNDGAEFIYEGGQLGYKTTITNVSDETLTNVVVTSKLPEGTKIDTKEIGVYKYEETEDPDMMKVEKIDIDIKENEENGNIVYTIPKLEKEQTLSIRITMKVNELEENVYEKEVLYNEIISIEGVEDYILRKNNIIIKPNYEINFSTENLTDPSRNTYVNPGDEISYTLNIKNKNRFTQNIEININEINGLKQLSKVEEAISIGNSYAIKKEIKPEETYKINIKGIVKDAKEEDSTINFKAVISQIIQDREGISETREIIIKEEAIDYTIKGTKVEDPINPVEPIDPENPETPVEKSYSISGTAWFDENEDGIKDEKEKLLKGILVKIKQINQDNVAEYLKDAEGNQVTAITDNQGKYEFKDLKPGKYIVEFEYNTKTYKLTPVTNKDSVPSAPTTSEGTTVKTDTLNVIDQNIENINIGLVLNAKFDLELNKYITKVTVKNNSGTTEYNYNNEQLAKVEIKAKQMASSTVLVEYVIEVKNNGAVPGTASVIVDYLPKGLKFSSEMNTNWYQGTDGNIYTEELKDEMLEPGETKQVKLILTKAMTENSTGTFTNGAEIYEDKNDFGLVDTNSTPANQEQKENDYSTAELIISTATGSSVMYIGIIIASMLILGGGIYLINKKVILEKNI